MEEANNEKKIEEGSLLNGFSPVTSAPMQWKSRRRLAFRTKNTETVHNKPAENEHEASSEEANTMMMTTQQEPDNPPIVLSEKRKALFEPLTPIANGKRPSAESLLPPPDFESASYPRGWLIGKKRKLVNVDVVESMRRIAVQEMNRKDREINGLNEQLEEDARCLEHLQTQLLEERSKRAEVERQNNVLQNQIEMLMEMIQENEAALDDDHDDDDQGPMP